MSNIPTTIPSIPHESSDSLTQIIDPYHDHNLRPKGYPDGNAQISCVQRKHLRYTIVCPFVLNTGDSWDFHVFTTPLHDTETFRACIISGNTYDVNSQPERFLGAVNVLFRHYDALGQEKAQFFRTLNFDNFGNIANQARTVSLGFEIHDTTPEIQQSGSLTVYRCPSLNIPSHGFLVSDTTAPYACQVIANIPENLEQAVNLPNSRTWRASEGAYCVALPDPDNKFSSTLPVNLIVTFADGRGAYLRHRQADSAARNQSYSPLSPAGAISGRFMTNLNTFTLDARQILEVVPSTAINDPFMPFSSSSPKYDPIFIKMYREMYNCIPPGTPVRNNASGDWFHQILQIAKTALPFISQALPGQAKVIATAATPVINALLDKALASRTTKVVEKDTRNVTQRMQSKPLPLLLKKKKKKK